ncbi:MAG TPA: nuclear transport factor 2 family protein [Acidobacteriota bacterium]|nr:nuclear transport factor 2 family protein [Acidobacteriota bacterium]
MKRFLWILLAISLITGSAWAASADKAEDEKGVRAAIEDYVLGIYLVEPERIERSVHPDLWKRGFYRQDGQYTLYPMTFEQLVKLAGDWNENGRVDPESAPQKIEIYEVLDKTASAKLTAEWGIDYFHLAKVDGKWVIMNVLWQSPPPAE